MIFLPGHIENPRPETMLTPEEEAQAVCPSGGLALFYPGPGDDSHAVIRAFCNRCPVEARCLETALATPTEDDHGIRGGTTRNGRIKMRRVAQEQENAA